MTPDNKPAAPGLVEAARNLLGALDRVEPRSDVRRAAYALEQALASHPVPSEALSMSMFANRADYEAAVASAPASAPEPSTLTTEALNEAWKRGYKAAQEEAALAASAPASAPEPSEEYRRGYAQCEQDAEQARQERRKRYGIDYGRFGAQEGLQQESPPLPEWMRTFIEGMSVSVDVSTTEGTEGHRYFGTVTEVMDDPEDKHGVTLLVQDAEPNFSTAPPVPAAAPAVEPTDEHPAARRMRMEFEAKYGSRAPLMRAANRWFNVRTDYNASWNRDREQPVTEADVEAAESAMLAALPASPEPASRVVAYISPAWLSALRRGKLAGLSLNESGECRIALAALLTEKQGDKP